MKKNFPPYVIPGRWYHAFIESDGTNLTMGSCDLADVTFSAGNKTITCPDGFHVLDVMLDMNTSGGTASSSATLDRSIKRSSAGLQYFSVGAANLYDYADVYFFGHFGE